ncbi:MAG: DUF2911 domain-containing protein [Saprospiraceae bacterium]|jgi:hypothetical protein
MKTYLYFSLFFIVAMASGAQVYAQDKAMRPSPLVEYKVIIGGAVNVMVNYSSPAVKGRKVWGDLVPFGEVWRTGANEATVFEVSRDVLVNGQRLPAGKYAFFTIPGEKSWTLIFNKEPNQWGSYNYKQEMDALRVNVKPKASKTFNERLTITVSNKGKAMLAWEKVEVHFTVKPL